MGALVVIPARMGSDRLPDKVLLPCDGMPLVWHTWAAVRSWEGAAEVVVATDDEVIESRLTKLGITVVATDCWHKSGTSRACQAAGRLNWDGGYVINVQADHPRTDHAMLDALIVKLRSYPADRAVVATAAGLMGSGHIGNRNRVKVVVDDYGEARWFTRQPLAYAHHHVGVYTWRRQASDHLSRIPRCPAAKAEGLEQLDWLQAGWTMPVAMFKRAGDGIDDEADIERFRAELRDAEAG